MIGTTAHTCEEGSGHAWRLRTWHRQGQADLEPWRIGFYDSIGRCHHPGKTYEYRRWIQRNSLVERQCFCYFLDEVVCLPTALRRR